MKNNNQTIIKVIVFVVGIIVALIVANYKTADDTADGYKTVDDRTVAEEKSDQTDLEETVEQAGTEEDSDRNVSEDSSADDGFEEDSFEEATVTYCFRNTDLLDQHFEKHGKEMGFSTPEEYEAAASAVINNPDALYKTEAEDGDGVYYLESTNEFVVLSTDGYIRTYFNPGDGKAYFDRQ